MIHHITAICADAQTTTDFYVKVLGLRLVKVTINQDDPGTYHLYFADRYGSPGTVMTFFPWAHLPPGKAGVGMVSTICFGIPQGSLDYWQGRLKEHGVACEINKRFSTTHIACHDPDGLPLELVEQEVQGNWASYGVPREHAISGFYGATLQLAQQEQTTDILKRYFGYKVIGQEANWTRLDSSQTPGKIIDIVTTPDQPMGEQGHGAVHHIAFRAEDKKIQLALRKRLVDEGVYATESIERFYFSSVYFREPGGVLFEIATDGPGFAIDEPEDKLGTSVVLPPKFKPHREEILRILPPFNFP